MCVLVCVCKQCLCAWVCLYLWLTCWNACQIKYINILWSSRVCVLVCVCRKCLCAWVCLYLCVHVCLFEQFFYRQNTFAWKIFFLKCSDRKFSFCVHVWMSVFVCIYMRVLVCVCIRLRVHRCISVYLCVSWWKVFVIVYNCLLVNVRVCMHMFVWV